MSPNPADFLYHLQQNLYHSRSNKHSNALAESIAEDLVQFCPIISQKAAAGELVYDLNFTLKAGTADWNVDLVLGRPQLGSEPPPDDVPIIRSKPSTVEIAVELKAIMTEHHKAAKNRKRDLEAHHDHVHKYNPSAIAGGVFLVNASPTFRSPLRDTQTTHRNPKRNVQHCIDELRAVTSGLDARCVIVVNMDNCEGSEVTYVTTAPAPTVGDPLHYDAFIQTICSQYGQRF